MFCTFNGEGVAVFGELATLGGSGDLIFAIEEFCGDRVFGFFNFGDGALCNDFAAMDAGAGADVNEMIGSKDGVFIVFDDDDGVANVCEMAEG